MRRFLILFLMALIPIQFAWSAQQGLRGHAAEDVAALGLHAHMGDHIHAQLDDAHAHDDHVGDSGHNPDKHSPDKHSNNDEHNQDGHHDSHYHPVFSMLLIEPGLHLAVATAGGPISRAPSTFISRIPPLFERPPAVRA